VSKCQIRAYWTRYCGLADTSNRACPIGRAAPSQTVGRASEGPSHTERWNERSFHDARPWNMRMFHHGDHAPKHPPCGPKVIARGAGGFVAIPGYTEIAKPGAGY